MDEDSVSYTPGPWQIDGEMEQDGLIVASPSQPFIAHVYKGEWNEPSLPDSDECEANAHLIAAAPDLLAALEALIVAWDEELRSDFPIHVQARAAIAKAKQDG